LKLVIIDNYDSFTFNLFQMLGEIAQERPLVFKNDEIGPTEISALEPAGVILSPGPGHPRDAGRMIEIIRDLDPRIPILGVCLGHQAIVDAFGGVVSGAGVIMHGKTSEVLHEGGVLFKDIASPFVVARYHSLAAERPHLPAVLRENAQTADGIIMAVEHRTRPVFGVQFHPESVATGAGHLLLANFAEFCRRESAGASRASTAHDFGRLLDRVLARVNLSRDMARMLGDQILTGRMSPAQAGALALALRAKGEHEDEVVGLASAVRSIMPAFDVGDAIDICGTGGDGTSMINVSTGAAFVTAAAGVRVAKTAYRARSSQCGSLDVLEALGVPTLATETLVQRALADVGLAFVDPLENCSELGRFPSSLEIGGRTLFNLCAPLTSPIRARRHVVGVFSDRSREVIVRALKGLGAQRSMVVHSETGGDELSVSGSSSLTELHEDGSVVEGELDPRSLGVPRFEREALAGGDAAWNAAALVTVLHGARNAHREAVALNAAAAILVAGRAATLAEGLAAAYEAIDSGAARAKLQAARRQA
jgi:anthranilate phosphoribosyltransferase